MREPDDVKVKDAYSVCRAYINKNLGPVILDEWNGCFFEYYDHEVARDQHAAAVLANIKMGIHVPLLDSEKGYI